MSIILCSFKISTHFFEKKNGGILFMKILADSSANLLSSADGKIASVPLTIRTDAKEFWIMRH